MEERPAYLDFLAAIAATGRATRSAVEIEHLLAACRRCNHFDDRGCSRMSAREFAALLADATADCPSGRFCRNVEYHKDIFQP